MFIYSRIRVYLKYFTHIEAILCKRLSVGDGEKEWDGLWRNMRRRVGYEEKEEDAKRALLAANYDQALRMHIKYHSSSSHAHKQFPILKSAFVFRKTKHRLASTIRKWAYILIIFREERVRNSITRYDWACRRVALVCGADVHDITRHSIRVVAAAAAAAVELLLHATAVCEPPWLSACNHSIIPQNCSRCSSTYYI